MAHPAPSSILALPREVIHTILLECLPHDLAALSKTCHFLRSCIKDNHILWRDVYMLNFDPPPAEFIASSPDWQSYLQDVVKLQRVFDSRSAQVKQESLPLVESTVSRLLRTATVPTEQDRRPRSINMDMLTAAFRTRHNVNPLLCSSSLFLRAGSTDQKAANDNERRQLSAKLHVLYGVAVNSEAYPTHHNARSKVYDLRTYTKGSFWGPFKDDGSSEVDWEKLEAAVVDLCFNLRQFSNRTQGRFPQLWRTPFLGSQPYSYVSGEIRGTVDRSPDDLAARDPYGITGTWIRVVCFLDFADLHSYNFSRDWPAKKPRDPLDTDEAIRLITLNLKVTKIEEPQDGMGKALPLVHFDGDSRSMHAGWDPNANSRMRGWVHLTPSGEVRWTTFSIFDDEERWRSESIQIGGVRSGRGVWGHWFEKDYLSEGPAGPTAFWKLTDEVPARRTDPSAHGAHVLDVRHQMLTLQNLFRPAWTHNLTVDVNEEGESLHGRATSMYSRDAGDDDNDNDDDDDNDRNERIANAQGTADEESTTGAEDDDGGEYDLGDDPSPEEIAALQAVPHLLEHDWEDEDDDPDFEPMTNALTGELIETEDNEDDDIPPAGEDDIVIEEALIEEELVPLGEGGVMPGGEEVFAAIRDPAHSDRQPSPRHPRGSS